MRRKQVKIFEEQKSNTEKSKTKQAKKGREIKKWLMKKGKISVIVLVSFFC